MLIYDAYISLDVSGHILCLEELIMYNSRLPFVCFNKIEIEKIRHGTILSYLTTIFFKEYLKYTLSEGLIYVPLKNVSSIELNEKEAMYLFEERNKKWTQIYNM